MRQSRSVTNLVSKSSPRSATFSICVSLKTGTGARYATPRSKCMSIACTTPAVSKTISRSLSTLHRSGVMESKWCEAPPAFRRKNCASVVSSSTSARDSSASRTTRWPSSISTRNLSKVGALSVATSARLGSIAKPKISYRRLILDTRVPSSQRCFVRWNGSAEAAPDCPSVTDASFGQASLNEYAGASCPENERLKITRSLRALAPARVQGVFT